MSKRTLTLLAVGMLGVGGFGSMDTEALAQTLSEESNSRSISQLHSRDSRMRHAESSGASTVESAQYPAHIKNGQRKERGKSTSHGQNRHKNRGDSR